MFKVDDEVVVSNWRAFARSGEVCRVKHVTPTGTVKLNFHGREMQFTPDGRGKGTHRDYSMRLLTAEDRERMERQRLVHAVMEARGDDWSALPLDELRVVALAAARARAFKANG